MQLNYEKLDLIPLGRAYVKLVYRLTSGWPREEIFSGGLGNQARRAAVSYVLNLAEGSGGTKNEFISFVRIAFRSLIESRECFVIGQEIGYCSVQEVDLIKSQSREIYFRTLRFRDSLRSTVT